jgi:hypothetical protein
MRTTRVWLALVAGCIGGGSAFAQNQDVKELQEEVQQLKQQTAELKAKLAELEKSQTGTPQVVNANSVQPTDARSDAPSPGGSAGAPTAAAQSAQVPSQTVPTAPPTVSTTVTAQTTETEKDTIEKKPGFDIYGFAQLDMGYDFNQNDPNWFDTMRPTKLPAFPDQFGRDGVFYAGVRQSRFGVKANFPTPVGEVKTIFEFEMFGVGVDAGQTTIRLRHAWGELGQFGAGQTWSPFMDPDVFPNSLEYWGPNGMVFFRNVQARWMPINNGNHQLWFALERPGASGDLGVLTGRVELAGVQGRFPAPDLSARFRWGGEKDYLQISGIGRYIAWDDLHATPTSTFDFTSNTWGWGVSASGNYAVGKMNLLKLEYTYGHGIENYMNDAPVDVAPIATLSNVRRPINGRPLPVLAWVAFDDVSWSERWTSTFGYSYLRIDNTPLQNPSDFRRGQYALFNLEHHPTKNAMIGGEFQWGRRNNFSDGFEVNDYRLQFGFRYNFDYKFGSAKK